MAHNEGHFHTSTHQFDIGKRLLIALLLNFLIPLAQIIGGIYANSMALISDAMHNFSDFTAILIAYIAFRFSQKGASLKNTFGYKRIEIIAAAVNVIILIITSLFIIYKAITLLKQNEIIYGKLVLPIALIGIVGNGISAIILHAPSRKNLNVKATFLHLITDFFVSVIVAINGLIIIYKPWYWIDPLLSILITIFILKSCWGVLKETGRILMNATPVDLDLTKVKRFLEQLPGIEEAHYLHAWNISFNSIAFSCHLVVPNQPLKDTEKIAENIRKELHKEFGIDHPVLQFETSSCGAGEILCNIAKGHC